MSMWYLPLLASAHPCRPVFLLPALEAGLLGLALLEELSCGLAAHVTRQAKESQEIPAQGFENLFLSSYATGPPWLPWQAKGGACSQLWKSSWGSGPFQLLEKGLL